MHRVHIGRSTVLALSTVLPLAACLALASCASSPSTDSGASATDSTSTSAASAASTTPATQGPSVSTEDPSAAPTILPGPISVAPLGNAAAPGVPAVSGASDLAKQPTIAAGTGTAATVLTTRDLVVGTGTVVLGTSTVTLKYVGTLFVNGDVFDTSWGSGTNTAQFPLSGVIPGFARGLIGMKVGGRREIVIPPVLGYGATATGKIPANSTIVFVVDMTAVMG